jgi:ribosomal-protein-alanine N-acetyltransferase
MEEPEIRLLAGEDEARACAAMMASSPPWLTFGRTFEQCLRSLLDATREVWVAHDGAAPRGLVVVNMRGPFAGYLAIVCVAEEARGSGLGTKLVAFAEERIFRDSPNVFLCVSDFNTRARALYERLGYTLVGELTDYLVRGHAELLMRKTRGPLAEFVPKERAS